MKPQLFIALVLFVICLQSSTLYATDRVSAGSGNWATAATWSPSGVPGSGDNITVLNGHTVTVDVDASCLAATIQTGGTLTMGGAGTLHIGGNFLNSGTFTHNSRPVEFNGSVLQTIDGAPDGGGYLIRFDGLTINNSAGVKMMKNIYIQTSLTLSTGQLDLNGMGMYICDLVTLTRAGGTLVKNGGYLDLQGRIDLVYTSPATTGDELPLSNISTLTINVGSGNSVTMASSTNARHLILTSGNLLTGVNTFTLGYSGTVGTVNHTSGVVVGNFKSWITATTVADAIFPVGTVSKYRPAVVSFTSAPSVEGTITASFVASNPGTNGVDLLTHPIFDGNNINKIATDGYWTLSSEDGLTGGTYSIDLTADGFAGVLNVETLHILKRANSTSNWIVDGSHGYGTGTTAVPTAHRTGLTGFSDFGIGSNAFDNPLPVELTSFAVSIEGKNVTLRWKTATETNNYGFEVEKNANGPWSKIGFIEGGGTINAPKSYTYTDANANGKLSYRLKQIDRDGKYKYSTPVEITVSQAPAVFELSQNYPNPFNPTTIIEFTVPTTGKATMKIFNTLGEEVVTLFDGIAEAGQYHQAQFNAAQFSSGIYFARLQSGDKIQLKKMLLAK